MKLKDCVDENVIIFCTAVLIFGINGSNIWPVVDFLEKKCDKMCSIFRLRKSDSFWQPAELGEKNNDFYHENDR